MIFEIIGMATVAVIGIALLLWVPPLVAFAVGFVCYKSRRCLGIRDYCVAFVLWYTDHVLKPVFVPILA